MKTALNDKAPGLSDIFSTRRQAESSEDLTTAAQLAAAKSNPFQQYNSGSRKGFASLSNDKLSFLKEPNMLQDSHDQDEFDPNMYLYQHRQDSGHKEMAASSLMMMNSGLTDHNQNSRYAAAFSANTTSHSQGSFGLGAPHHPVPGARQAALPGGNTAAASGNLSGLAAARYGAGASLAHVQGNLGPSHMGLANLNANMNAALGHRGTNMNMGMAGLSNVPLGSSAQAARGLGNPQVPTRANPTATPAGASQMSVSNPSRGSASIGSMNIPNVNPATRPQGNFGVIPGSNPSANGPSQTRTGLGGAGSMSMLQNAAMSMHLNANNPYSSSDFAALTGKAGAGMVHGNLAAGMQNLKISSMDSKGIGGLISSFGLSSNDAAGQEQQDSAFDIMDFPSLSTASRLSNLSGATSGPPDGGQNLVAASLPHRSPFASGPSSEQHLPSFAGISSGNLSFTSGLKPSSEFSIQLEEFPALPGFKAGLESQSDQSHGKDQQSDTILSSLQTQQQHFQLQSPLTSANPFSAAARGQPDSMSTPSSTPAGASSTGFPSFENFQRQGDGQSGGLQQIHMGGPGAGQPQGGLGGLQGSSLSQNQPIGTPQSSSGGQSLASQPIGSSANRITSESQSPAPIGPIGKQPSSGQAGDKFGLLGLLSVIRMTELDVNTLALGTDLTTLGLNLNSPECLYGTFGSPWANGPCQRDPEYALPTCYYLVSPVFKSSHLNKFTLETLFYIFYSMPKDMLQACAAAELYNREWRYHKDLKLWFYRPVDHPNKASLTYVYFDLNSWERRPYLDSSKSLEAGFLSEEEVRVLK